MIDFFHNGSNIGFSLNGVSGFILLIYLLIEIFFFIITKVGFLQRLIISTIVYFQLRKKLPEWWSIKVRILDIQYSNNQTSCYVSIKSKFNDQTYDGVKVSRLGKIIETSLYDSYEFCDNEKKDIIRSYKRDKALENLGIKS